MVVLHLSPKSAIIAIFKMSNESGTEKTARQAEDRPVSSTEPSRTAGGSPAAGTSCNAAALSSDGLLGIHTALRGRVGQSVKIP